MASPASALSGNRSWYAATIADFLAADANDILGALAAAGTFDLALDQRNAWLQEIQILRRALAGLDGILHLEFSIPRLGTRADAVVLAAGRIFVLEFKIGAETFTRAALDQVWDYALDLKNFHAGSHAPAILPILVATAAARAPEPEPLPSADQVYAPLPCTAAGLGPLLRRLCAGPPAPAWDLAAWAPSPYRPTPTIIEAARALYANHRVEDIARCDAGARNLAETSQCVRALMQRCQAQRRKAICFVTGVPGAGKTLVGLDVAAPARGQHDHCVYLSGNGPLVRVLCEALARDRCERERQPGRRLPPGALGQARRATRSFIQNVHHYRNEAFARPHEPPHEHTAIFDEAQRAWDQPHLDNWLQRRKRMPRQGQSEARLLISYMDRLPDWALIVCLVGEGQEINAGEAGIGEWLSAIADHFPSWDVYLPTHLAGGHRIPLARVHTEPALHLAVSMRSFRAESVSGFVQALLDGELEHAAASLAEFSGRFPVVLTRELARAKRWLRERARGNDRFGLLVSSKAERLKPLAIDVRVATDPVHWFLDPRDDIRSSLFLEDAATEFDVQGLELDWACVTWDGDLRRRRDGWSHHRFLAKGWQKIHNPQRRAFQLNAYRVLLTRARQGMVICVPEGDAHDATRLPEFYNPTYEYFARLGLPVVT